MYFLTAILNGKTIRKRTENLDATIAALKPDWLHTEVYITVKKDKHIAERRLTLQNAKRVFQDDIARQVFINNLLLT